MVAFGLVAGLPFVTRPGVDEPAEDPENIVPAGAP
jgi:hypothetical protein